MNIIQRNDVNSQWSPSVSSRVQNSTESYSIPNPTCVNPGHEHLLAANKIGSAFALQYFQMAKTDPTELSRFYNFESHVCRIHPTASGITEYYHAAGVEQINNLLIREYKDQPDIDVIYIRQLQCQMSLNGSVFVSIHGTYNYINNTVMNFQQSAFLIPVKENDNVGYSILNDILFYEQVKPENATSSVNANVIHPKVSYDTSSNKRNNSVIESVATSTQISGAVAKTFPSSKSGPTNETLMYPASSVEMLEISEIFNNSGSSISKSQTTLSRNVAITNIPTSEFSGPKTTNIEPEVSVNCICPDSQFVQVHIENVQVETTAPTINSAHSTVSSYEKISHKTNVTSTSFETSNNNDTNSNKLTVAWLPQTTTSNIAAMTSMNRPPRAQRQNLDKKNTDSQTESHENPKKSFADAIKVMSQNKPIRKPGNEETSSRSYSLKTKSDKELKKLNELSSGINYPAENSRFNVTDRSALVSDRSNITDQSNEFININHSHKSMNKKLDSNNQIKGSLKNSGSVEHQRRPTGSDHNSNTGYGPKKFNYASKHYDNKVLWTQIPKEVKGEKVKESLEEQMRLNSINGYVVEFNQYPSYALIEFDSEETAKQVLDLKLVVDDKIIPISIPRSFANNNGRQSPNYMNNRQQKRDNYNHHNNRQQKQHSSNNNSYHRHSNSQNNGNVNNTSNNNYQKSSSFALNNTSSCTTEEGWTTAPNKRKYKTNSANRLSKKTMSRNKTIFEPTNAPVAQAV